LVVQVKDAQLTPVRGAVLGLNRTSPPIGPVMQSYTGVDGEATFFVPAECRDEDVRLVDTAIGGHAPGLGIVRGDSLAAGSAPPRLRDLPVGKADGVSSAPAEEDIELRVAEEERLALVDQRHLDVVAERLRHVVESVKPRNPAPRTSTLVFTRASTSQPRRTKLSGSVA
jgi:hypothetical protein